MSHTPDDRIASCIDVISGGGEFCADASDWLEEVEERLEDHRIRIESLLEKLPVLSRANHDLEIALEHIHRAYVSYDYLYNVMGEATLYG